MVSGKRFIGILALCLLLLAAIIRPGISQENPEDEAKTLFEAYAAMEQAGDSARFSLYAEDAKITIFKAYHNGDRLREKITLADYKALLQNSATPRVFSNPVYSQLENTVRVKTQEVRQATTKKKKAPPATYTHQFVIGKDTAGSWRILEETTTLDAGE